DGQRARTSGRATYAGPDAPLDARAAHGATIGDPRPRRARMQQSRDRRAARPRGADGEEQCHAHHDGARCRAPRTTRGAGPMSDRAGVEVRRAQARDGGTVAEIYLESFKATLPHIRMAHTDDECREHFSGPVIEGDTWVAVADGEVVGFVALAPGWIQH